MKSERSFSGWLAALTVAIVLTLAMLAVDKHLSRSGSGIWQMAQESDYFPWFLSSRDVQNEQKSTADSTSDSRSLARSKHGPNRLASSAAFRKRAHQELPSTSQMLRRPPEPASGAILREPLTAEDFVALPLSQGSSSLNLLMQSMDSALETPLRMVSLNSDPGFEENKSKVGETAASLDIDGTGGMPSRFPIPVQLFSELDQVEGTLDSIAAHEHADSLNHMENSLGERFVGAGNIHPSHRSEIESWTNQTRRLLQKLTSSPPFEETEIDATFSQLESLSSQSRTLGDQLQNDQLAQLFIRTGYSVQRRVDVWKAVRACLSEPTSQLLRDQKAEDSIQRLRMAIDDVGSLLDQFSDGRSWHAFLLVDELQNWAHSPSEAWRAENELPKRFLSRVHDTRLDASQRNFLLNEKIELLTSILSSWNCDPVDYHDLLLSLEQVELDSQSRMATTIADAIQSLNRFDQSPQQKLAEALNAHYRNANLRLTISQELLEKFLPKQQYEIRPIRQTILGARTSGDSAVQTRLSVKFHADPSSWNIELGVVGDVVSSTSSSKGPAVFHNTGIAQVQSQRFLKIGREGYSISSAPTAVESQDYLNRMTTDFDGFPIIGEFARLIAREQFNQKRGIAKRITQRKIAQEADNELDKKLEESIQEYEQQLQQRILGPLNRLRLDPQVVSMSTAPDRLAIRYRLAHNSQLSAFTPRPRAPSGSLISLQLHQSVLNNTLERIGLSGRSWTLPELYNHIATFTQSKLAPPEDVPDDISVRFADRNPIAVEMIDGHLRLHLRIAEFRRQEGLHARNFVVTSTYVPLADGLDAGLIRDPDGVIEIQGKNLAIRDRLALRVIFARVFVSQPKISLISEQWQADPKANGLAISQLEVRDGWLAVALSGESNEMSVEVAEKTRRIKAKLQNTAELMHSPDYR